MIKNPLIGFLVGLILVCLPSYFLHQQILQQNSVVAQGFLLPEAYSVNFFMAVVIGGFLYLIRKRFISVLGFAFMASSLIKFAVFFALFYPAYSVDGDVTKPEFASFFIPYALCLTVEVVFLVRVLNRYKPE